MKSVAFVIITIGKSLFLEKMILDLSNYARIILVDNSPEGVCKHLADQYNIQYWHELKPGVSYARNAGAALLENEDYIFFLDDDLSISENWKTEMNKILSSEKVFDLVGGRVIADYPNSIELPEKYLYLVGEKNLGYKEIILSKDYLGGCDLLISRKIFTELGGFNVHFGHKGNSMGLNEDVVFQEQVRKRKGSIYYNPNLKFIHHWNGTQEELFKRIKLQGIYDRQTDLSTNKVRFFLRMIKYNVWLWLFDSSAKQSNKCDILFWDCLRYKAYINNSDDFH